MWINLIGKSRKCKFCGKFHDPSVKVCPMEEFVRNLEDERANCDRSIKTYSDSTLRLARQGALTSDIDTLWSEWADVDELLREAAQVLLL